MSRRKTGKDKPSVETAGEVESVTEELSATLMAPPTRFPPPPVESRAATLPLQQLAWEDFERLLVAVVRDVLHWQGVRRYGVKGQSQHGIDLYGYMACGKMGTCQAKDVKDFRGRNTQRPPFMLREAKPAVSRAHVTHLSRLGQ